MIATHDEAIQNNDRGFFLTSDDPLTNAKAKAGFIATGTATTAFVFVGPVTFISNVYGWSLNSTESTDIPPELNNLLNKILTDAREENFEDGNMSQLAKGLIYLVEAYGEVAVQELARRIVAKQIDAEVASEVLQWMGRINHQASRGMRLWLLERNLLSNSLYIRDSAGLGIASLNDPAAIPSLRSAIAQEKNCALREDLEQVLRQLEGTRQ